MPLETTHRLVETTHRLALSQLTGSKRQILIAFSIFGFAAIVLFAGLLRFPLQGDEVHFWLTSQWLFADGFPSLQRLRSYNELSTPLPFLLFGGLDKTTGLGIAGGRALDIMASMGTLAIILLGANFSRRSAMAMLGLLFFPYFWYLAPLLYTDATAVFFAVAGFALGLRGRNWAAGALFVLGIACRQYIVAFPLAIVAFRYIQARSLRAAVARETFPLLLSIFSLLIWYRFFGGAGPKVAIDAQAIRAGHIYPNHAVYFLTTVGVYFVVVEAIIFRSLKASVSATQCVIAVSVAVLFLLFPPLVNVNTVTDTMGYLDKAVRLLLPDSMRMIVFLMLAIATCLRFSPFSLAGLVVYANAALMLFAHVAWDKYALPAIAVLWLLSSFGDLRDVRTKHHDA